MSDETTTTDEAVDEELEATDHPDVEAEEEATPKQGSEEWWGLFGDEAEDLRAKYDDDPAELVKAYRAQRSQATQMAQELAEHRRYVQEREEYDKQHDQPTGQQQSGPQPGFDITAMIRQGGSLFDDDGELSAEKLGAIFEVHGAVQTQMIAQAVASEFERRFGEYDQEKVAPYRTQLEEDRAAREIAGLEDVYGERFDDVAGEAVKLRDQYPDLGITAMFGMAAAALQTREANRRRLESQGFTIDKRGRPAPPKPKLSSDELELQAMEQIGRKNGSLI